MSGEKDWTICTPQPDNSDGLSDAYKAQMQEIARHRIQGCTSYQTRDLGKMNCHHVTLHPGDVLYMPKGIVHYATTRPNVSSTHLTIGLIRKGHTWQDVFQQQCLLTVGDASCRQLGKVLLEASSTPAGIVWNNLAAAPFDSQHPIAGAVCRQLNVLVSSDHPAALRTLLTATPMVRRNTYEKPSRELLALLPDITECQRSDLLHDAELARSRRSTSFTPQCRLSSPVSCKNVVGCDCDWGRLSCVDKMVTLPSLG